MRYTFWQVHRSPNSRAKKTKAASDLKLSVSGALQGSQGLLQSQQTPWLPRGLVPGVAFTAHLLKYCTVSICWGAYLASSYARWIRFAFRIPQIPRTNKQITAAPSRYEAAAFSPSAPHPAISGKPSIPSQYCQLPNPPQFGQAPGWSPGDPAPMLRQLHAQEGQRCWKPCCCWTGFPLKTADWPDWERNSRQMVAKHIATTWKALL